MRIGAIIAWTVGVFFGWIYGFYLALRGYVALIERFPALPRPSAATVRLLGVPMLVFICLGMLVLPAAAAVLGMRGRLPGTRRKNFQQRRGFSVVATVDECIASQASHD